MKTRRIVLPLLLTILVVALSEATGGDSASGDSGASGLTAEAASASTGIVATGSRQDLTAASSESPAMRWLRKASVGALRSFSSGAVSIPPSMVTVLAVIGGVVVAVLGAGALAAIVLSLFGIRMCYILGTCHDPYGFIGAATPYEMPYPAYASIPYPASSYPHAKSSDNTGNELPQYDAYSQVSYPTGYQKRSLEYVGPILKALGSAYGQHYGQQYYGQPSSQQLGLQGTPRKTHDMQSASPEETNHNPDK